MERGFRREQHCNAIGVSALAVLAEASDCIEAARELVKTLNRQLVAPPGTVIDEPSCRQLRDRAAIRRRMRRIALLTT